MAVHGPRPPGAAGGNSGLSTVATGPHLKGTGTAGDPIDLTDREAARLDALHDALRARVGAWDMTAAAVPDGNVPPATLAYGFRNLINNAPTHAPSLVTGSIAPAPAELRRGSDTWRIVALTQLTGGAHTVELILGAPSTDRRVGAPNVNVAAADTWVAVPGVVIDAARLTTYTLRIAGGAAQYVRADTLRALTAAAAGGDATAAGTSHAVAGDYVLGLTAGRGLLIANTVAVGRVVVTVDADDGPSTAEAAEVPTDIDWRIGDTVLRTRDATRTYAPRSTLGGRHWESSRSLTWSDVPAGTIAAGTVEVTALGPSVEARGVVVGDTAPDHPPLGLVWVDTSDEDDVVLRWWDGYSWDVVLQGGLQYGTRLPATPAGGRLFVLTADDGTNTQGLYASLDAGVWTQIGGAAGDGWLIESAPDANVDVTTPAGSDAGAWSAWTTIETAPALAAGQAGRVLVIGEVHAESQAAPAGGGDRIIMETRLIRHRRGADTVLSDQINYSPRNLPASSGTTSSAFSRASRASDDEHIAVDTAEVGDVYRLEGRVVQQTTSGTRTLRYTPARNSLTVVPVGRIGTGSGPGAAQQTTVLRPATWARAWIRAASEAAALAGVAAATWTDAGPGTPPTGAHWSLDDVPAGAGQLYELVALVTAQATAWTFSPWSAIELTTANTQYSVDGSTAWHAVRAAEDRYERHRDALGAWSAAIPLYAADEVVWSTIVSTVIQAVGTHQPGVLIALPSQIALHRIALMRYRMRTETSGFAPVLESDLIVRPDWLTAALYANRASVTDDVHTLILTLEARGLGLVSAGFNLGAGPADAGGAAGLKMRLIRPAPPVVSHSQDATHLAVYYVKNQSTRHVLQIDVM